MTDVERRNVAVVRRYFDGCNSGDLTVLLGTLTVTMVRSCNDTIRAFSPSFLRALRVLRGESECRVLILVKRQMAGLQARDTVRHRRGCAACLIEESRA